MIGLIRQLLGGERDARAVPRLTPEQAEAIARGAAAASPYVDQLLPGGVERAQGRLIWRFRTPARGSWLGVDVDDDTGDAVVTEHRGR